MPYSEYALRLETQKKVIENFAPSDGIQLLEAPYELDQFLQVVQGLENQPERGQRCEKCMDLRIQRTAEYAANNHFDYFCTTLSVSPHKDAQLLHDLSEKYSKKYNIAHIPADFKKNNGYLESIRLSKEWQLYRQNYCGCIFSKPKESQSSHR